MNVPSNLRYTEAHEWVRAESDGTLTVGITDHAQAALGDLVYLELPAVGRVVAAGEACAVVNSPLTDAPEEVNKDAYAAWFFKLKPADGGAYDGLLAPKAYEAVIGDE